MQLHVARTATNTSTHSDINATQIDHTLTSTRHDDENHVQMNISTQSDVNRGQRLHTLIGTHSNAYGTSTDTHSYDTEGDEQRCRCQSEVRI